MLPQIPAGYHRRLFTQRFLAVADQCLLRVRIALIENAYDGDYTEELTRWGVAGEPSESILFDTLKDALAWFPPERLRAAVAAAPADFATVLATEHGFTRSSVIPGSIVDGLLRERGHEATAPVFRDDTLLFQCLENRLGQPARLWSLRCALDGTLLSKELALTIEW